MHGHVCLMGTGNYCQTQTSLPYSSKMPPNDADRMESSADPVQTVPLVGRDMVVKDITFTRNYIISKRTILLC